jgi:hypothetical protein
MALVACLPSELLGGVVEGCFASSRGCQLSTLLRGQRESSFVLSQFEIAVDRSPPPLRNANKREGGSVRRSRSPGEVAVRPGGYALKMAKTKQNKRLYDRMRASGVRKKIARQLSALPGHASRGRKAPKPLREAVDRLEATVVELKDHSGRGKRKAAARKAARTRRGKAESRSRAARKGARKRAKS